MQSEKREFKLIPGEEDIEGKKEVYGATFRDRGIEFTLTEHEVASMLIFASGSIGQALQTLGYMATQIAKEIKP